MSDLQHVQSKIISYLAGDVSIDEAADWAADIAISSIDSRAMRLAALVVNLHQLLADQHRDEGSVRHDLFAAVASSPDISLDRSAGEVIEPIVREYLPPASVERVRLSQHDGSLAAAS